MLSVWGAAGVWCRSYEKKGIHEISSGFEKQRLSSRASFFVVVVVIFLLSIIE